MNLLDKLKASKSVGVQSDKLIKPLGIIPKPKLSLLGTSQVKIESKPILSLKIPEKKQSLSELMLRAKIKLDASKIQELELKEKLAVPENQPIQYEPDSLLPKTINLNAEQMRAVDLATAGENVVLVGAAGTGKTTSFYSS